MVSLRFLAWHFLGKHSITVCACMVCDYIIWTVKCVHNMTCFTLHLYTLLTYWFISFRMSKQVHVEIFFVLRCDTVVLGDWFWTFWDNIVVPSSKISILTEKMRPLHCLGMARTHYIVTVSSPRRMKTSHHCYNLKSCKMHVTCTCLVIKTICGIKYYLLSIYLFMVYLVTVSVTGIYNVKWLVDYWIGEYMEGSHHD
jgi:hypothetical protein